MSDTEASTLDADLDNVGLDGTPVKTSISTRARTPDSHNRHGNNSNATTVDDGLVDETTLIVPEGKTLSLKGMAFNLANSTIGAGIVSLPFAMRESGYILGPILLILFGIVTNWSLRLLVHSAQLLNNSSSAMRPKYDEMPEEGGHPNSAQSPPERVEYEEIAAEACGNFGFIAISICVILINFGAATGYLTVMGDLAVPVMEAFGLKGTILANEYFLISMLALIIVLPLSLLRHFASLRFTSYISIFGIFLFAIAAFVFAVRNGMTDREGLIPAKFSVDIFLTAPIFIFSYACHTNLMNAYSELHDTLKPKMLNIIHGTVGMIFVAYLTVGQLGYLTFGRNTRHNILNNYPDDDAFITISRIAIIISVILSYPMCSYPARHSIHMLVLLATKSQKDIRSEKPSWPLNLSIVLPFFAATLAISLLFKDIVAIFGLTGATASTAACFVAPPLIYMLIRRNTSGVPLLSLSHIPHWLLIVGGAIVGITSTIVLLLDIANPTIEDYIDMDRAPISSPIAPSF